MQTQLILSCFSNVFAHFLSRFFKKRPHFKEIIDRFGSINYDFIWWYIPNYLQITTLLSDPSSSNVVDVLWHWGYIKTSRDMVFDSTKFVLFDQMFLLFFHTCFIFQSKKFSNWIKTRANNSLFVFNLMKRNEETAK